MRRVWKEYFENLLKVGSNEVVIVNARGLEGVGRKEYFGNETITRDEVVEKVRKFKNGKAAGIDGITGERIKNGDER